MTKPNLKPLPSPDGAHESDTKSEEGSNERSLASGTISIGDDAVFAGQLIEQYNVTLKADASAKRERVRMGIMLLIIRKRIESTVDSINSNQPGRYPKGSGFKAWIEIWAPSIPRPSAIRYIKVASALLTRCKIESPEAGERLLSLPETALPKKEAAKQLELFDAIEGKSQREIIAADRPISQDEVDRIMSDAGHAHDRILPTAKRLAVAFYDKHGPALLWTFLDDADKKLLWDICHQIALDLKKGME